MVQQYLLPCDCGRANPVTVAQAGRTVSCGCGRDQIVPKLAVLRQLEPVTAPVSKGAREWSSSRGILFVIGVLLALAGMAAGGLGAYLIRNVNLAEIDKYYDNIEQDQLKELDQMTPIQIYEIWERIRVMGPGDADSAPTAQARHFHTFWLRVSIVGFAAAAVGILLAAGSLVGTKPSS
jgi:hypothetical protein